MPKTYGSQPLGLTLGFFSPTGKNGWVPPITDWIEPRGK
jgi:hypothetical protein